MGLSTNSCAERVVVSKLLNQGARRVWDSSELSTAFGNVWTRLGRVLRLIEEDRGGNELVEKKRGKRWVALDEPMARAAAAAAGTAVMAQKRSLISWRTTTTTTTTMSCSCSLQKQFGVKCWICER